MRPRAAGAVLGAFIAGASLASDPRSKPQLTLEQREAIGDFTAEIAKIPVELYGNAKKLDEFVRKDPDLVQLSKDKGFQGALAILAGIGKEKDQRARPGPKDPEPGGPGSAARSRYEEDYYRHIGETLGDQAWPFVEGGRSAYRRKDFQVSLRDYERAVRVDPTNAEALLGYGHSANELGDYALAAMAAKQLLARDPGNRDALGLYHFAKDRAPAIRLPSAIFQSGSEPRARAPGGAPEEFDAGGTAVAGALAPARLGAPAPAGAGPSERSAFITREAAAALRVKDYSTAHRLATRAIELNAANAQALNFRAMAANRLGRYAEAAADAGASLALAPDNAPALQTRSWASAKMGDYQGALRDARQTLSREPENAYALQNEALALAALGDRAGALESLRRSAAADERFQERYGRALQLPADQDLALLFDDDAPSARAESPIPPDPARARRRLARMATFSAAGGVLIALGILHVVSAGWREKARATLRRVLAPRAEAPEAAEAPRGLDSAFWTQYRLVKEIGLGGMGVVYEAQDRSLERRVAVKKMRDEIRVDPEERLRFVNEAKLVAQLRHPNIVDIYGISEEGDDVYLVFEYVDGRTLDDHLKAEGPLSPEAARKVLGAAAEAVEHAHERQIIHRDLKPSNVMITRDGRVKVMDFGVARRAKDAAARMSQTNSIVGTPAYMAPEQEQGAVRRESDVFALGVCLYEMLTGHLPFAGSAGAMHLNKLNGKLVAPSRRVATLPPALDQVLAKALAGDPDRRYRTPSELVAAVDAAIASRV